MSSRCPKPSALSYTTPKLKSLDGTARYLWRGVAFEQLDQDATALDNLSALRAVPLDELFGEGARRMLVEALEVEVSEYVERHRAERGEDGSALVVRNGHARARQGTMGAGTVEVRAPRVDDRRLADPQLSAIPRGRNPSSPPPACL